MNDGFMRPAYPEQVIFSYYQASLVCDLIARDFGEKALLQMLLEYKAGRTTPEVFQKVLGHGPEGVRPEVRRVRARALRGAAGRAEGHADGGNGDAAGGRCSRRRTRRRAAIASRCSRRSCSRRRDRRTSRSCCSSARATSFRSTAAATDPTRGSRSSTRPKGDTKDAAEALSQYVLHNETDYPAHLELARLRDGSGRQRGRRRRARPRAVHQSVRHRRAPASSPRCTMASATRLKTVRERRAVVALAPGGQVRGVLPARARVSRGGRRSRTRARRCCTRWRRRRTTCGRRNCCCRSWMGKP